ncbi:glycoside hydrolase domain-containing protein [Anaerosporobacter sp.]
MAYWGIDVSGYPGDTQMKAWKNNSNIKWTGFYLAPADSHSDTGWMSKKTTLENMGYNLVPIYVGQQSTDADLTSARATSGAQYAIQLAKNAGFSSGTYIYLDVEQGGTLSSRFLEYIHTFIAEIAYEGTYKSAVYCSYSSTADQIKAECSLYSLRYWVYRLGTYSGSPITDTAPAPSGSGVSYAKAWQLVQNKTITIGGYAIKVDVSSSSTVNPAK